MDQIFALRQVLEKKWEYALPVYCAFMDLEKAALSQLRICRTPLLTFDQPFMDDGECVIQYGKNN